MSYQQLNYQNFHPFQPAFGRLHSAVLSSHGIADTYHDTTVRGGEEKVSYSDIGEPIWLSPVAHLCATPLSAGHGASLK